MTEMEFEMPKSFEDIKPAVILEPRVYRLQLVERRRAENKARTGDNIELDLMVIGEGEPADGMMFTKWLSLPNPTDEGRMTRRGQTMVDWKLDMIQKNVLALGGTVEGNRFSIPEVCTCKAFISRVTNEEGVTFNQLDGEIQPDTEAGASGPQKT